MSDQCIKLAESVLEYVYLDFQASSCGPDFQACSACEASQKVIYNPPGHPNKVTIEEFNHEDDCPFILANKLLGEQNEGQHPNTYR